MEFIDIILGIPIIWGLYKGLKNGLFVELASLIALIAGIYGAIHFSYIAGDYMAQHWNWNQRYINITAFLVTFFIIVFVVQLAGKFITKIADFAQLGILNKVAGGIFGALKYAVILGAFLVFFDRLPKDFRIISDETKENSILYQPVRDIGSLVFGIVLKNKDETTEESSSSV